MTSIKTLLLFFLIVTLVGCASPPPVKVTPVMLQRAENFMAQGVKKYKRFQYPAARAKFVMALHEYQSFNEKLGVARSRLNLARVTMDLGDLEETKQQLLLARKIIDNQQLTQLDLHADIIASSLLIKQKKYDQAEELLTPYLADNGNSQKNSAAALVAIIQNRTRIAFGKEEDERQWLERYRQAVAPEQDKYLPRLLRFEASLALQKEGAMKALKLLEQALNLYSLQANPRGVAYTSLERAAILDDVSQYEKAIEDYERGLSAGFRIRDRMVVTSALDGLIRLYGEIERKDDQETMEKLLDDVEKAGKKKPWYLLRRLD